MRGRNARRACRTSSAAIRSLNPACSNVDACPRASRTASSRESGWTGASAARVVVEGKPGVCAGASGTNGVGNGVGEGTGDGDGDGNGVTADGVGRVCGA